MSTEHLEVELGEGCDVEEVVLGFRKEGEFYELAVFEPPVRAVVTQQNDEERELTARRE